jgi:hypothetical protein
VNERVKEKTDLLRPLRMRLSSLTSFASALSEDCVDHVQLTMSEYELVRTEPTHFALVPGHELAEAEIVREENGRFIVVEKIVEEAMLERTDPRS